MEESTALWLLGLAHSEHEAMRNELDEADRVRTSLVRERDELREAHRKMLGERIVLRDERDRAAADVDAMRDALKSAASGWLRIGEWAFATLDGRIVRCTKGEWAAEDADHLVYGSTAIEAASSAGWLDFPGLTDHSAADP